MLFVLLMSYLRRLCPTWVNEDFTPIFTFKTFIVFALAFRPTSHIGLIFVCSVSEGPNFILYMWISVFLAPFVEKAVPSPLNFLGILVKNQLTINVKVHSWLSVLLFLCQSLCPFHTYAMVTAAHSKLHSEFGIRNVSSPTLFFFSKWHFGTKTTSHCQSQNSR